MSVRWFCDKCLAEMKFGHITTIHSENTCLYNGHLCGTCLNKLVLEARGTK